MLAAYSNWAEASAIAYWTAAFWTVASVKTNVAALIADLSGEVILGLNQVLKQYGA